MKNHDELIFERANALQARDEAIKRLGQNNFKLLWLAIACFLLCAALIIFVVILG